MPNFPTTGEDAFYVIISFAIFVALLRVFDICVFSSRPPPGSEADADLKAAQSELAPQDLSEAEFQDILRELKKIDAEMSALSAAGELGGEDDDDGGDGDDASGSAPVLQNARAAAVPSSAHDAGERKLPAAEYASLLNALKVPPSSAESGTARPPPPPPPPPPSRSSGSKKGDAAAAGAAPLSQESAAAVADLQDGFLTSSFTQAYHAHLRRRA